MQLKTRGSWNSFREIQTHLLDVGNSRGRVENANFVAF